MRYNTTMRRMASSPLIIAGLSLFFLLVAGVMWAKPVQAAGFLDRIFNRDVNEATTELNTAGDKSINLGQGSQGPMVSNMLGFTEVDLLQRITGPLSDPTANAQQKAMLEKKYGRGAIGDITGAVSYLYTPPAGTAVFVADLMNDAHIVPRAQAQGLGFAALDPILSTWKMFRNLAYLLYVILFLVIGFMVMFKAQMGKAAVTLQTALPNIVISLIFVTFSYAIAGFLIDLMYVVMYLLIGMFPGAGGTQILDDNFITMGIKIIMGDGTNTGAFKSFAAAVDGFVSQTLNFSGTDQSNTWYGMISGVTMSLIMAIAILIGVFKLFFELLKTYVTIVLMIAFSPLLLMLGALPGQDVFQGWIRDLVGNLLAFPTTLLIIIVFRMFTNSNASLSDFGGETGGFLPPFLIGRGTASVLTTLVGIGIVLIMPELIQQMKKAVGVKDGIFQVLAKDMGTNFVKQGVYAGAPMIGAPVGAVGGMAKSGLEYAIPAVRDRRFQGRQMLSSMWYGNPDEKGNLQGGWRGGWNAGRDAAKTVKVSADRAMSGNFFDPENTDKLLAALGKQAEPKHAADPSKSRASSKNI